MSVEVITVERDAPRPAFKRKAGDPHLVINFQDGIGGHEVLRHYGFIPGETLIERDARLRAYDKAADEATEQGDPKPNSPIPNLIRSIPALETLCYLFTEDRDL